VITVAKELHLGTDFPKTDHAMWHKQVEVELKGADFDKRMLLRSYEGIELQALYTEEVFPTVSDSGGLSGYVPFVRGAQPFGNMLAWTCARNTRIRTLRWPTRTSSKT
jgi:methylmalonyl-CoA mutase